MIINCRICQTPFREGEEVRFVADAYWHELGSKTVYSISRPHNVLKVTMVHRDCDEVDSLTEI